MHRDVIIAMATQVDAPRQAARLERTRQVREATEPPRSPRRQQLGTLLRQAGTRLHQTIAPLALPEPRTSTHA